MALFDLHKSVELRVLGPQGAPYVRLEDEFVELFRSEGFDFLVPRLFSAPPETTIIISIGVGVVVGVSTHLINSFLDRVFRIKQQRSQERASVKINIHIGDKYIILPTTSKEELLERLEAIRKQAKEESSTE